MMESSKETKKNLDDRVKCKGCSKSFKKVTILKHLYRKNILKKCKQSYSEEELNDMKSRARIDTIMKSKSKKTKEPKKPQNVCEICEKVFRRKDHYLKHKELHEGKSTSYSCKFCAKSFPAPSKVIVHERIHTGEKPYSCEICSKRFSEKGKLNHHERAHTGEKPHFCKICAKKFREIRSMKKCEMRHTQEKKKYPCKLCNKLFSCLKNLANHVKRHVGLIKWKPRSQDWRSLKNFKGIRSKNENSILCACGKKFWKGSESLVNHRKMHEKNDAPLLEKYGIKKSTVTVQRLEKSKDKEILNSLKTSVQKLSKHPYACTVCHMTFKEPTDLGKNLQRNRQSTP